MRGRRILALTTDSFGGRGGIANYARDTIRTMAARSDVHEVVALASLVPETPAPLPAKVRFVDRSGSGAVGYAAEAVRLALSGGFDAVWASHATLAPLAWLAARRSRAAFGISLHGLEVWQVDRPSREWALARADLLMPVSNLTLDRYRAARGEALQPHAILPGAVDLAHFQVGPKPDWLLQRYGLEGRRVLLTLARIGDDHVEKGFARVLDHLPGLIARWPDLTYVIAGGGRQQARIENLARGAGLGDRVKITGVVPEAELADHYRMADAFILPSSGEGLGLVLLEAQACGVPTIASSLDGGAEAVAGMGWAVDPNDAKAVEQALGEAWAAPRIRPKGLDHFAIDAFAARMNAAVDRLFAVTAKY
jgi:phosphatidylinositol alpha-1,6-mannosyltransferase